MNFHLGGDAGLATTYRSGWMRLQGDGLCRVWERGSPARLLPLWPESARVRPGRRLTAPTALATEPSIMADRAGRTRVNGSILPRTGSRLILTRAQRTQRGSSARQASER